MNRLEYYIEAKNLLINKKKRFACTALRQLLLEKENINIPVQEIENYFPEIKKRLPLKTTHLELLDYCIDELNI